MKKVMFNDKYGLTKAVLEGRKTMTRRLFCLPDRTPTQIMLIDGVAWVRYGEEEFIAPTKCQPRYKVGEVVAVAQSYKEIHEKENISPNEIFNRDYYEQTKGWTNKMFVYASLMYHHIRITNVRIERLQDISDEDCLREGVIEDYPGVQYSYPTNIGYCGQYPFSTPRHAFAALIDKVSSKGTWAKNPWVFVYEFELVK